MPLRNPFRRAGGAEVIDGQQQSGGPAGDFQKTPVAGSKPLDIKEPTEYKLSAGLWLNEQALTMPAEINDSGVYLPPSPPEKPSFWHSKSNTSTTSSNHRSLLSENEPFSISRESFESYRRSFDISARSPIPECLDLPRGSFDTRRSFDARRSLDIRRSRAPPRSSLQERRSDYHPENATAEEGFEDVGLNDEPKPVKKRGLFARFGDNTDAKDEERPPSSHHHFGFTGRKRAQSGQGSELKSMGKPSAPVSATEVSVETR
ncbi:hypothetical protein CC78DRAFT_577737 [Lojkania enalia]|uniref:Uncharacterized protein n=1 Tax=Lojkania enalia TaxID=147567 RepID=A0A9P4KCN8_9PLEO|nr:hypothetical protein CC78DRAFT_577737 [Didymosphaeria enalia]